MIIIIVKEYKSKVRELVDILDVGDMAGKATNKQQFINRKIYKNILMTGKITYEVEILWNMDNSKIPYTTVFDLNMIYSLGFKTITSFCEFMNNYSNSIPKIIETHPAFINNIIPHAKNIFKSKIIGIKEAKKVLYE